MNLPGMTRAMSAPPGVVFGADTMVARQREQPHHPNGRYDLGVLTDQETPRYDQDERCELCDRPVGRDNLTRHHLLPRAQARRMRRRKMARRELKRRDPDRTVVLCSPCHRNVHTSLSNGDLGKDYDSLEALSAHPDVRRFTDWVRSRSHGQA